MELNNIDLLVRIAFIDILISTVILASVSLILIFISRDAQTTTSRGMGAMVGVTFFSTILITANHSSAIGFLVDQGALSLPLTMELDRSAAIFSRFYVLLDQTLQIGLCG